MRVVLSALPVFLENKIQKVSLFFLLSSSNWSGVRAKRQNLLCDSESELIEKGARVEVNTLNITFLLPPPPLWLPPVEACPHVFFPQWERPSLSYFPFKKSGLFSCRFRVVFSSFPPFRINLTLKRSF